MLSFIKGKLATLKARIVEKTNKLIERTTVIVAEVVAAPKAVATKCGCYVKGIAKVAIAKVCELTISIVSRLPQSVRVALCLFAAGTVVIAEAVRDMAVALTAGLLTISSKAMSGLAPIALAYLVWTRFSVFVLYAIAVAANTCLFNTLRQYTALSTRVLDIVEGAAGLGIVILSATAFFGSMGGMAILVAGSMFALEISAFVRTLIWLRALQLKRAFEAAQVQAEAQ